MKTFKVYKHPVFDSEAIKDGVSFPAFFLNFLWMLYKKLWVEFWIWLLLLLIISYTFYLGDTGWRPDSDNELLIIGTFILIQLIYYFYPLVYGNAWLGEQLEKEGYKLIDTVQAKDKKRAIKIAENNYNNLDEKELGQSGTNNTIPLIIISIVVAIIFISIQ